MLSAHEGEATKWILDKVEEWESKNPDPDETEDEGEVEGVKGDDIGPGVTVGEDEEMVMGGGGGVEILSSRMPIVGN